MKALRILYLEELSDHVELVAAALQPQFSAAQVENVSAFQDAMMSLQSRRYDVILASAVLRGESVIPRLHQILENANSAPVIIISGDGDEKLAANAIKHGASDYLVKSRESLEVLPYLIQRLLKKKRSVVSESHSAPRPVHTSEKVDHLMTEIEHVSHRVHNLQDSPNEEATIASLREDLHLLRQFAENLAESRKTGKLKN